MEKRLNWFSADCGAAGSYGYQVPIPRERARRLIRRYSAKRIERVKGYRMFHIYLTACPKEVRYALDHGAAPIFSILTGI